MPMGVLEVVLNHLVVALAVHLPLQDHSIFDELPTGGLVFVWQDVEREMVAMPGLRQQDRGLRHAMEANDLLRRRQANVQTGMTLGR